MINLNQWLWELFLVSTPGLLYRLLFPEPKPEDTLPPRYIRPPDVPPPSFEGGQCPVPYNITVNVWIYKPNDELREHRTHTVSNIPGPLLGFRTKEIGFLAHHFGVDTPSGFYSLYSVSSSGGQNAAMFLSQYEVTYFWDYPNIRNDRYVYGIHSIVRSDGQPDNCGSLPPPVADRDRCIPVAPPVPVPVPFPPIVTPPIPVPLPIPPAPPLPPHLPRPPISIRPPSLIGDVHLNFNFYNDIDFNFNININNGNGTLPIEPFQALAKLIYAVWMDVKETREVIDRMAGQLECLHKKFCREVRKFTV